MKVQQWSELTHKNGHVTQTLNNQSERSFNSGQSASGSCTRDSGAGDSVESEYDTLDGPIDGPIDHNQPLIYHVTKFSSSQNSPTHYSNRNSAHIIRKPTFTTFVGDSDTESVQIVDYTKVNL